MQAIEDRYRDLGIPIDRPTRELNVEVVVDARVAIALHSSRDRGVLPVKWEGREVEHDTRQVGSNFARLPRLFQVRKLKRVPGKILGIVG